MRTRAKALTVSAAMVLTFAIMPTFGAAAAEPLEDGSYDVVIGETTYTVDVVEGAPTFEGAEGVEFTFAFDEETNRVLDEFDVTVDGVDYDVVVADDGTVTVTEEPGDGEEPSEDPEGDQDDLGNGEDDEGEDPDDEGEDADDGEEDGADEDGEGDVQSLEEGGDVEAGDEDEADDGHGALVSTVAQCAPNGWQAREAGLPNHGFFVRAAAKGEVVEFDADGETHSADLSSQEGADAFCELADQLVSATADESGESETAAAELDADSDGEHARGKGKSNGRAKAPGQAKKDS